MSGYVEPLNEAQAADKLEALMKELERFRKEEVDKLLTITEKQNARKSDIAAGHIDPTSPDYIEMLNKENEAYERHMESARDADMRPEKFEMRGDVLIVPGVAELNTNNRLLKAEEGNFSELFDFEQVGLIGVVSQATKDEVNNNNPYEIKNSIAYKSKDSDIITNMYVVDYDSRLWMMADQRDADNNIISQNQDSFRAIGINPSSFKQGLSVNGSTSDAAIQEIYQQLSPNNIRVAINKDQLLPHESRVSYIAAMKAKEQAEVAAESERRAVAAQNVEVAPKVEPATPVEATPQQVSNQAANPVFAGLSLERLAALSAKGKELPAGEVVMLPIDNDIADSTPEQGPRIDNPYEDKYGGVPAGRITVTPEQIRRFEELREQERVANEMKAEDRLINGPEHVINEHSVKQLPAPDIKTSLMAHQKFNSELEVFKHKEKQLHEYRLEYLAEAKAANALTREKTPNKLNLAPAESFSPLRDKTAYLHRLSLMRSVLKPAELMMHEGAMISSKDAQKMVNGQYHELDNGQFMALNDIEDSMLAGKPSDDTNERLTKELGGKDEKLVKAITLRDKGSDTETNIYVVESATGDLWVRADQTDAKGNIISRNDDSFAAVGLAGTDFKQGIPSDDYRFSDGKEVLLGQLDANSMRVMISEQQMSNFGKKTAASDYEINTGLTPRKPANEEEAFVDTMYDIKPLNAEQSKNIGEWARYQSGGMFDTGSETNPNIPKGAVFNDAYEITNKIGGGSVIVANMTVADTEFPYHERQQNLVTSIDRNGEPTNNVSWQSDLGLDKNSKVNADDIRKGLDNSNKGAYNSKNISAPKMDGSYGAGTKNTQKAAPVAAKVTETAPASKPVRSSRP